MSDQTFEALLGRKLPIGQWSNAPLTPADPLSALQRAKSAPFRWLHGAFARRLRKAEQEGRYDLTILFAYNMPFRAIAGFTGGVITPAMVEQLLAAANGSFWRGMAGVVKGYSANRKANRALRQQLEQDSAAKQK